MPKPKLYHHFLRARITDEQRLAIKAYAKAHGLVDKQGQPKQGEAVRELIAKALEQERRDFVSVPRQPTDEMIDAGVDARARFFKRTGFPNVGPRIVLVANHPAGTIYQAMVEQALADS